MLAQDTADNCDTFKAILSLGLSARELAALKVQGFVSRERRGNVAYYKLRYRLDGKQRVRYIGTRELAGAIESELAALQKVARLKRQLKALARVASKELRSLKWRMQPFLELRDFHFHGRAIRKRRASVSTKTSLRHHN